MEGDLVMEAEVPGGPLTQEKRKFTLLRVHTQLDQHLELLTQALKKQVIEQT